MKQLSRLRLIFIIYFIAKMSIDIIAGGRIASGLTSYFAISPKTYYAVAVGINIVLFLIGLLLFSVLLEKKNWARIILLVIGWLAVLDFFSGLLLSSKGVDVLTRIDPATNWDAIMQIDRVTDFIGFLFWGYAIFILQFSIDVRRVFLSESKEQD